MKQCPDVDVSNSIETLIIIENSFVPSTDEEHGDGSKETCCHCVYWRTNVAPVKCSTFYIFIPILFIISHANKMDDKSDHTPVSNR